MKKSIAFTLAVLLALGMFAGCGNTADTPQTTTEATEAAEPVGTLLIHVGAAFEFVYDATGKALQINGLNEAGQDIAPICDKYIGRDCVHGVRGLLRHMSDNKLIGDAKTMAVRVKHGDPLPSQDFLETITTDTQYLADEECTGVKVIQIGQGQLNNDGTLTPQIAKTLAYLTLGCTAEDLTGADVPAQGLYTFSYDGKSCTVDAVTGAVTLQQ